MKSNHFYTDFLYILQKLSATFFLLLIPILVIGIFIRTDLLLPLISAILIFSVIGTFHLHMFPNIETTQQGVKIPFFFQKLLIPWSDIVGLNAASFRGGRLQVVSCRKITPFHWLYGLIYGGNSVYPSFLISSRIGDFDTLIREIKDAIGRCTYDPR